MGMVKSNSLHYIVLFSSILFTDLYYLAGCERLQSCGHQCLSGWLQMYVRIVTLHIYNIIDVKTYYAYEDLFYITN